MGFNLSLLSTQSAEFSFPNLLPSNSKNRLQA
jgi:hypothetical protein